MAEDLDVEAMLEEPFADRVASLKQRLDRDCSPQRSPEKVSRKNSGREPDRRSTSRTREDKKSRKRSRSRDRHRRSSRSKSRSRDRKERRKSRSRSRSRERRKEKRSDSRERRRRSRSRSPRFRGGRRRGRHERSRSRSPRKDSSVEERDQRTVLCVQLAAAVRQRDLEEFFSAVGKVREVRLILDNKTRKHKGIAYIEFYDMHSVPLALALNGQRLCGRPIIIQPSMAEKNRAASASAAAVQRGPGPLRLYVGSLHFNITEDMLRGIFEPFGRIDKIELMRDPENNRSKGYGFITFFESDDAKKALEQLNGFELAGRPMKVNYVTDRSDGSSFHHGPSHLDSDETDRTGIELGTTGRLQLMAKLAEGTGIKIPQAAVTALQSGQVTVPAPPTALSGAVATPTFVLTNMFDPKSESSDSWQDEIMSDVLDECRKHGGAYHVYVDKLSAGNVYVKCPSVGVAVACVGALHGRWFSGRLVTAAYVPVPSYHSLFPESIAASTPL